MHKITINGKPIELESSVTVLDAALSNGIEIPHLCDHPMLEKHGACRICLVSVKGMPRLMPSCTMMTEDGMEVDTETPEVRKARRGVLEFMLINHPLECPSCDKAGICRLQDYAVLYGAASSRFKEKKLRKESALQDPLIRQNRSRCILCTRCVRVCQQIQGLGALAPVGRGNKAVIEPFGGHTLDCEYCGSCLSVCPVGALTAKEHFQGGRPWDTEEKVNSSCPHCGLGCDVEIEYGRNRIQKVSARGEKSILCARGSFGYDYRESAERLHTPMVREGGVLREATWEEALDRVSSGLMKIRDSHGGKSIAGIASPHCSNEDNFMFQRFVRGALDSPNIDSTSRLGLAASRPIMEHLLGPSVGATPISKIAESDAVIVVGGDPVSEMPVLGVRVRQAHRKGTTVVAFGRTPGLSNHCSYLLDPGPGRQWPLLEAFLKIVIEDRGLPGENGLLENELSKLELPNTSMLPDTHFVEDIECLARMIRDKKSVTFIVGRDTIANKYGARNLLVVAGLCYALGAKMILSSDVLNENGLIDMGCVPGTSGLSLMEMFEAAGRGTVKAMYIMGANPAESLPGCELVQDSLDKLDLLVVQDIFLTETAKLADVVLPVAAWAERDGTFTDASHCVRRMAGAMSGDARPDWQILRDLSSLCGKPLEAESAEDVMREIARTVPAYGQVRYSDIEKDEVFVESRMSYAGKAHEHDFSSFYALPHPANSLLKVDSSIFSMGTAGAQSKSLESIRRAPSLQVNAPTARRLGLKDHKMGEVSTDKGSLIVDVVVRPDVADGRVALVDADGLPEFNRMAGYSIAPVTKTPYPTYKDLKIAEWDRKKQQVRAGQ